MTRPATENVYFYALLAILVFVPLPYASNRAMHWAFTEIAVFALFSLWIVTNANLETLKQPVITAAKWPIILLTLACIWVGLQSSGLSGFESLDVHATRTQLIKSVSLLCVFILTLALVNTPANIRILAWTLLLSGTLQAVYGTLTAITEQTTASGTFINRNHLAGYLEMTLAVGLGLLIADLQQGGSTTWRQSLRNWINTLLGPKARVRVCLALMVIGLILTQSRMGNAAFFTALMFGGIAGLIIFRRASRSLILLFSSLIIIDTFLMGAFFGIDKLQERIEQTDMSTDTRVYNNLLALDFVTSMIWSGGEGETQESRETGTSKTPDEGIDQPETSAAETAEISPRQGNDKGNAVRATTESPALQSYTLPAGSILSGTGAGTYYTFFPLYRDENVRQQNIHAHNDFFEFGLEFGVIGSVFLIGVIVLTMLTAIRAQTRRRSRLMQAMGFACMMAIFSLMIHSATDFNLQIYANSVTYIAILALPFIAIAASRHSATLSGAH